MGESARVVNYDAPSLAKHQTGDFGQVLMFCHRLNQGQQGSLSFAYNAVVGPGEFKRLPWQDAESAATEHDWTAQLLAKPGYEVGDILNESFLFADDHIIEVAQRNAYEVGFEVFGKLLNRISLLVSKSHQRT